MTAVIFILAPEYTAELPSTWRGRDGGSIVGLGIYRPPVLAPDQEDGFAILL
jgi:hypothetical protein